MASYSPMARVAIARPRNWWLLPGRFATRAHSCFATIFHSVQRRASGPPSPARAVEDRAGIREAVLRMRSLVKGRVVVAGHSYGGRQSSMLAAEEPDLADGLMLMSYPLHPPGKPSQMRTGHFLSLRIPSLFVSGTKDSFGTVAEIRTAMELIPAATRLVPIEGAGHDLAKGRFDVKSLVVAPLWDLVQPAK